MPPLPTDVLEKFQSTSTRDPAHVIAKRAATQASDPKMSAAASPYKCFHPPSTTLVQR